MLSLAARLEARVRYLSQTIGERHFLRPEALTAAARYIEEQLSAMGVSVLKHEFFVNDQSFVNLEVLVPRADPPVPMSPLAS
jgi:acetylornithine deacetylase/succinyl-diaminopimelate desuccinylase-like protein